jgi:hypothetical protein
MEEQEKLLYENRGVIDYARPHDGPESKSVSDREGSHLPFARTQAEREAAGDPRLNYDLDGGVHHAAHFPVAL